MSGLCAVAHWHGPAPDRELLARMAAAAAHRGPDGVHTWLDGPIGLAHLALHVTPEDRLEQQPIEDERHVLVADARIDNRDELLPELRAQRHLRGDHPTDAAVILAAHRRWGHEAPAHLVGDYAYVLFDRAEGRLFAARDGMGMRCLHFRAADRAVVIATEIAQLLAHPEVPAELHEAMVAAHLAGPYGRPGWTFYRGVHQLRPGHALLADEDGVREWRTWEPEHEAPVRYRREDDYAEHLYTLLEASVRARARSTAPLGAFLSGGLDSGAVVSTLGHLRRSQTLPAVKTYSWAFADRELAGGDERSVSDHIVAHYGLESRPVPADELWPLSGYPAHGPHRDAPYVGVYQPLVDRTLELAHADGVRAMFSGDRGDEMVGDWVFDLPGLLLTGQWTALVRELRSRAAAAHRSLRWVVRHELWAPLWRDLARRPDARVSDGELERRLPPFVRRDWARASGILDTIRADDETPPLGSARRRRWERVFYARGVRDPALQERTHARHGLAFVDPWSDRRIGSFVLAVPQWVLQRPSEPKRIARRAIRRVMPAAALQASGKAAPAALFTRGLGDRARAVVLDLMTDMQAARRGFVDEDALRGAYRAYLAGSVPHDIWWPLTLEMWLRRYWT